jgi:hypothetical protein
MTRTAVAFCYLAEMICADEVIGNSISAPTRRNESAPSGRYVFM